MNIPLSKLYPLTRWLNYRHLPEPLQEVSKHFHEAAFMALKSIDNVKTKYTPDAQIQINYGLQHLIEAKDCFVRAMLATVNEKPKSNNKLEE